MADRGLVTELNGKPMSRLLTTVQLGDCRKLFRGRAASRGVTPTVTEIDDALWLVLETDAPLPELYEPVGD
jgi:hypothetical protein